MLDNRGPAEHLFLLALEPLAMGAAALQAREVAGTAENPQTPLRLQRLQIHQIVIKDLNRTDGQGAIVGRRAEQRDEPTGHAARWPTHLRRAGRAR